MKPKNKQNYYQYCQSYRTDHIFKKTFRGEQVSFFSFITSKDRK